MNWQDTAYIIMWRSSKSGGTYTELRRTDWGRDRLLKTLVYQGIPRENIHVEKQRKPFIPERINRKATNGK